MLLTDLSVLGINGARGLGAHLALTVPDLRTTPTGVTYDRSDLRAIPASGGGATDAAAPAATEAEAAPA